ncbi:MAG: hypothetical protein ACKO0Z_27975, partial [Betaproteobacteria bacterium]
TSEVANGKPLAEWMANRKQLDDLKGLKMQSKQSKNSESSIMANTQTTAKCQCKKLIPLTDARLRDVLKGTNDMIRNAMHGSFWPELEQACRAIEAAHGIGEKK